MIVLPDMSSLNKYTIDKDYSLLPDSQDAQHFAVNILRGPYEDVIFKFGQIKIIESDNKATFAFTYSIGANEHVVTDKEDFESHLSRILESIINSLPEESVVLDEHGR